MVRTCAGGSYDFRAHDSRNKNDRLKLQLLMDNIQRESLEKLLFVHVLHDLTMILQNSTVVPTELPDAAINAFKKNFKQYKHYLLSTAVEQDENEEKTIMQRLRDTWEYVFGDKKSSGSTLPKQDE